MKKEEATKTLAESLWGTRKSVQYDTKDWTVARFADNAIVDLPGNAPPYWTSEQRGLFIESVLLGLPITGICLRVNGDGSVSVVDGMERIRAINDFVNDKFALQDSAALMSPELAGLMFSDLAPPLKHRFLMETVRVTIFDHDVADATCEKIRLHLNAGGAVEVHG